MDKQTLLDKLSASPEERTMLARVLDKYQQMERRNIPTATAFVRANLIALKTRQSVDRRATHREAVDR